MATDPERDSGEGDNLDPNPSRVDPRTALPLPDPYAEYVPCPWCGEAEVEVFCYQLSVVCHACGQTIEHAPPPLCGVYPYCQRSKFNRAEGDAR